MAIEFCTDNSGWSASPRISFSYDVAESEEEGSIPVERVRSDSLLLESPAFDFNFSVGERSELESSTADELFSDGKILPLQFKENSKAFSNANKGIQLLPEAIPPPPQPPPLPKNHEKKETLREIIANSEAEEKSVAAASKAFWRFKRSSSFNGGNAHSKTGSIWSLPLLSRSKSTGSSSGHNPKNDTHKALQKPPSNSNTNPKASSLQKPPIKKTTSSAAKFQYGSHANSVRISPVLNVPPPYISKGTTTLFGFGFFCNSRDANRIRKKPFSPLNASS